MCELSQTAIHVPVFTAMHVLSFCHTLHLRCRTLANICCCMLQYNFLCVLQHTCLCMQKCMQYICWCLLQAEAVARRKEQDERAWEEVGMNCVWAYTFLHRFEKQQCCLQLPGLDSIQDALNVSCSETEIINLSSGMMGMMGMILMKTDKLAQP